MRVTGTDDRRYSVRRRWLPWRRRSKGLMDWLGVGSPDLGEDPLSAVVGGLVMVVAVLLGAVWFGELLLLLLLLPLVVLARSVFGTPWVVEVHRRGEGLVHSEAVRGWAASAARIEQISAGLASGPPPPRGEPRPAPVSPGRPRGASPRTEAPPGP